MKITLILFMCSYVSGSCLPPHEWPETYDDMYDCMNAGYKQSIKKINEIGRDEVNKHEIFIKFGCVIGSQTNT